MSAAITDPCVVFALRRESMYFRRRFSFQQHFPGAPCRAQFRASPSLTVLMLETGLGAAAMETALRWCLNTPRYGAVPYRPRFVLSAGFSGALQPEQRVGDLILATEIIDQAGNRWPTRCPDYPTEEVHSRGRLLTVTELVGDPRAKQRLGERYKAMAVDMETAVVARLCQEHGVPFACLRVISDDLNTPLSPHLVELLRQGRVSPLCLTWTVLRHPSLIRELWRLAGQTRFAARQLLAENKSQLVGVGNFLSVPCSLFPVP
jgi:nucleoside phosphorylase